MPCGYRALESGGGINFWLMRDVSYAADVYYRNKKAYFDKIKEKPEGQKA
jgi:hypothetical protein